MSGPPGLRLHSKVASGGNSTTSSCSPRRKLEQARLADRDASKLLDGRKGSHSKLPDLEEVDVESKNKQGQESPKDVKVNQKSTVRRFSENFVGGIFKAASTPESSSRKLGE